MFRRRRFFDGKLIRSGDEDIRDIAWLTRAGIPMTHDDWNSGFKSLAVFLNGEAIPAPNVRGERVVDDTFLLCFNAHAARRRIRSRRRRLRRGMDSRARHGGTDRQHRSGGQGRRTVHRWKDVRSSSCARRPDSVPVLSTYRLQMRGSGERSGVHVRRRAELNSTTSTTSGSPTYTCHPSSPPAKGSTHGYDVVDPTTVSAAAWRPRRTWPAVDGRACPWNGSDRRHRAQPRGRRRAHPERVVVGRAQARPRVDRTRRTSTSTGDWTREAE